jgi:hypothetical protein
VTACVLVVRAFAAGAPKVERASVEPPADETSIDEEPDVVATRGA